MYSLKVSQLNGSVAVQSCYSKDSFMKLTALWPRLVLGPGFASPCFVSARYQSGLSMDWYEVCSVPQISLKMHSGRYEEVCRIKKKTEIYKYSRNAWSKIKTQRVTKEQVISIA